MGAAVSLWDGGWSGGGGERGWGWWFSIGGVGLEGWDGDKCRDGDGNRDRDWDGCEDGGRDGGGVGTGLETGTGTEMGWGQKWREGWRYFYLLISGPKLEGQELEEGWGWRWDEYRDGMEVGMGIETETG